MSGYTRDVLFVCRQNTARSQMAEVLLNHMGGGKFHAESAGIEAGFSVNPLVVEVMWEIGIDISLRKTKSVFDLFLLNRSYNFVITVCDATSAEKCPVFPGKARRLHWSFPDPSTFEGSLEQVLEKTRGVREAIRSTIVEFITEYGGQEQRSVISALNIL